MAPSHPVGQPLHYLHLPLHDVDQQDLLSALPAAFGFLDSALAHGASTAHGGAQLALDLSSCAKPGQTCVPHPLPLGGAAQAGACWCTASWACRARRPW